MTNLMLKSSLLLAVTLFSSLSFAATTGTSTAKTETDMDKILKNTSVTDFSLFFGPAVTSPTSSNTADNAVGETMPLTSLHFTAVNYKMDENTKVSPTIEWMYNFTDNKDTNNNERGAVLNDPFVQISRSNLLSGKVIGGHDVALNGHFRWYAPVAAARAFFEGSAPLSQYRLGLTPTLQIANSRFSIAASNYVRLRVYQNAGNGRKEVLRFYTGPQVNFAVNSRVTAFVLFEAEERFYSGKPHWTAQTAFSSTDIQPGAEIQVLPNRLTLVPYFNWFLNQSITTASINLNADIRLF